MIDPFNPLKVSKEAMKYEVEDYYQSWMSKIEVES